MCSVCSYYYLLLSLLLHVYCVLLMFGVATVMRCRNDASARKKPNELSAPSRPALSSVPRPPVTTDGDDQPLSMTDRLKSTPADPIHMPHFNALNQPSTHARCHMIRFI